MPTGDEMKKLVIVIAMLLSGCALTPEQVAERAHKKTNAELCMALIRYPQYSDGINAELAQRGHMCDVELAKAQVQYQKQSSDALLATGAQLMQASVPHTLTPAAAPASIIPGNLQSQSTSGALRYCKYSNGVVNTINIVNLCPLNTQ
jgi:hypothetical protein